MYLSQRDFFFFLIFLKGRRFEILHPADDNNGEKKRRSIFKFTWQSSRHSERNSVEIRRPTTSRTSRRTSGDALCYNYCIIIIYKTKLSYYNSLVYFRFWMKRKNYINFTKFEFFFSVLIVEKHSSKIFWVFRMCLGNV